MFVKEIITYQLTSLCCRRNRLISFQALTIYFDPNSFFPVAQLAFFFFLPSYLNYWTLTKRLPICIICASIDQLILGCRIFYIKSISLYFIVGFLNFTKISRLHTGIFAMDRGIMMEGNYYLGTVWGMNPTMEGMDVSMSSAFVCQLLEPSANHKIQRCYF